MSLNPPIVNLKDVRSRELGLEITQSAEDLCSRAAGDCGLTFSESVEL